MDLHLYVVCELQPYRGAGSAFGTTNTEHLKRIRSHGKELCLYIYIYHIMIFYLYNIYYMMIFYLLYILSEFYMPTWNAESAEWS